MVRRPGELALVQRSGPELRHPPNSPMRPKVRRGRDRYENGKGPGQPGGGGGHPSSEAATVTIPTVTTTYCSHLGEKRCERT